MRLQFHAATSLQHAACRCNFARLTGASHLVQLYFTADKEFKFLLSFHESGKGEKCEPPVDKWPLSKKRNTRDNKMRGGKRNREREREGEGRVPKRKREKRIQFHNTHLLTRTRASERITSENTSTPASERANICISLTFVLKHLFRFFAWKPRILRKNYTYNSHRKSLYPNKLLLRRVVSIWQLLFTFNAYMMDTEKNNLYPIKTNIQICNS